MSRKELKDFAPGLQLPMARAHAGSLMPYFLTGIQGLSPMAKPGKGTFAITETGHLLFDPEVLSKLFVEEAGTVVLHEYLHEYLNHADRFREMIRKGLLEPSDMELWNDACDAEINDNLEEAGCVFPRAEVMGGGPVTPQSLGLKPHRPAEEYAIQLKKKDHKPNRPPSGGQGALPACGSASGNPVDGEPEADHPDSQTQTDREMQRKDDAEKVVSHQKSQGDVPSGVLQTAEELAQEAEVSWERELEGAVLSSVRHKAGAVDYTFTEQARMQSALWESFGEEAPVMPGMWAPLAKVALVIDTSGSMFASLSKVCQEAQGILRAVGGMRLTLIACDAEVHEMKEVSDISEVRASLSGGGGTDFRPAFEAIEQMPPRFRPDVVIFATDGWGFYPKKEPGWKHVWLCVDGEIRVDWGKVIEVAS
jgi:predicted metal-dependent peptidase